MSTILNAIYTMIIGPLKLLFEVIFTIAYFVTNSAGLSIIILSLVMNFLLLPLYNKADKIQEEENIKEKELKHGVDHIKKTFKGDERYMILQTYYRQNNYSQFNVLKGSISLLLEIPFFIAAYDFLSNLNLLTNMSFGPIRDLSSPDALLNGINLLPILMTIINIASSIIYTKGSSLRSKIQLYVMALAFMIILYNSPSGLVLYWTLNNLFSLIKNIFIKIKNSSFILSIVLSIISVLGIIYIIINPLATKLMTIGVLTILLLFNIPLVLILKKPNINKIEKLNINTKAFVASLVLLSILIGVLIPSNVIVSSPGEFIDMRTLTNPLSYLLSSALLAIGTFIVWFSVFYFILNDNFKRIVSHLLPIVCVVGIVDYLFFGTDLGVLSKLLEFDNGLNISIKEIAINIVVIILIFVVFTKIKIKEKYLMLITVCFLVMSTINVFKINNEYKKAINSINESREVIPSISLSKDKKNVVMIMLDRAIGSYLPYLFNEKPELQEQFAGFTYYPNTISFGSNTNFAVPALFGGYEYTPEEINKRSNESLESKHNEALKVLPVLFNNNGYDVTIFDPPYAGYEEIPDLSIYDDYEGINAYNTTLGMFKLDKQFDPKISMLNRNLFCFGIMKVSPLFMQKIIYNNGAYNSVDYYRSIWDDSPSIQQYVDSTFVDNYAVLLNLPKITNINNDKPLFFVMTNNTTHEKTLLKEPEYIPDASIDNTKYDEEHIDRCSLNGDCIQLTNSKQMKHYHINMAAMIQLGNWFDYLREIGVYDNTRIIIASDHGYNLDYFEYMQYNPLLMFKDYNDEEFKISDEFMTNADSPTLLTNELLDDAVNPFTGNKINNNDKINQEYQKVFASNRFDIEVNNGNTFIDDGWLGIKNNVLDSNNWIKIENLNIN